MSTQPGGRLGSYEVSAKLGEGGMGEVYRARDPRLNRDVAIKLLRPDVAADADRLARFKREAQVLAALNHPHIAQIYGLEDADGVTALVLELVEGPTLADRIAQGPIPFGEALSIARQIADALEAAHEQGIIHRDLKPANIKVRDDGTVKVLDFGLAKEVEGAGRAGGAGKSDPLNSPTITTPAMTRMGMILGTAAYMSPEQARGKAVDKRADIWAFGAVLFEMLSGRTPFPGDDVSLVLARVIERDPEWSALPASLPPSIASCVRRCLVKDPRQRIRDMGDVRLALDGAHEPPTPAPSSVVAAPPRRGWSWTAAGLILAASIALAFAAWRMGARDPSSPLPTRFAFTLPDGVRLSLMALLISPDGRTIAVEGHRDAQSQVYFRSLDALDAKPVPGTENHRPAAFSPDGEWLAIRSMDGLLKRIPIAGGPSVTVGSDRGWGRDWGAEHGLVIGSSDGLMSLPAGGGKPRKLTSISAAGEFGHFAPSVLPNGHILFFGFFGDAAIGAYSPRTGETKRLLAGSSPQFARSGHLIFARQNALWAVAFDPDRLEVRGDPRPVVEGVEVNPNAFALYDVSADGTLAYVPAGSSALGRSLVWVDRRGREEPLALPPGPYDAPRVSPDGRRVIVQLSDPDHIRLAVYDLERQVLTPLTPHTAGEGFPVWTPDSARIVYTAFDGRGVPSLMVKPVDGTGQPQRMTTVDAQQAASSWAPDGRSLLVTEVEQGRLNVKRVAIDDPSKLELLVERAYFAAISPDGRWMAYSSQVSGRNEVYVQTFPDPKGGRWQVSRDGGSGPLWAPAGDELFFRGGAGMMRVTVQKSPAFQAGRPERMFDAAPYRNAALDRGRPWDLSRDGQRVLMIKEAPRVTVEPRVVVVEHWFDELRRLVPIR